MNQKFEKLRNNIRHILSPYPVLFAYLFGSYAIGQPGPFSDIDIAIYIDESAGHDRLKLALDISLEIDRLIPGAPESDVRVLNDLPLSVAGRVLQERIILYSVDEEKRVEYEKKIRLAYFDFYPVIREYRKIGLSKILHRGLSG